MPPRRTLANAIRFLSMDAVQQAGSGHPGAPLGMADIAEVLWRDFLSHNPANPHWPNRDRFVLSNGHGSMLLYSLLHLSGYDLDINDIKRFRQLHSQTPGHPEYGYTAGVETTTGPLGQGLANGVGMALAEKVLAAQFNRPGYDIVNHFTYVFVGDGCLMEGISHEACSLAGTLGLGKLILVYDDNGISIDGAVADWFSDDTPARFAAYGWHVVAAVDGHDADAIALALAAARAESGKPSLICCRTQIGWGAPTKAGGHECHGAPLGETEIAAARVNLEWPHAPFEIPDSIYQAWSALEQGARREDAWRTQFALYQAHYPELASELERRLEGRLPDGWAYQSEQALAALCAEQTPQATRQSSQQVLNKIGPLLPELLGGSADLSPSNLTRWQGCSDIDSTHGAGNYLRYGVREFAMSAIMNGLALHGGFIPYGGTFLTFTDYARNAVRMSALMRIRVLYVYTHDSIGLGEDGPTHQPVEQLATLRMTPHLHTWRPCDRTETCCAWQTALKRLEGPSALVLSRQNLTQYARSTEQIKAISKGGYILRDCAQEPDLILLATGSEVDVAMRAAQLLEADDLAVRVVSMPCVEIFEMQEQSYREHVLPRRIRARVAVEAAIADFWHKYVGLDGCVVGMTSFGESAPAEKLFAMFGITPQRVAQSARNVLANLAEMQAV